MTWQRKLDRRVEVPEGELALVRDVDERVACDTTEPLRLECIVCWTIGYAARRYMAHCRQVRVDKGVRVRYNWAYHAVLICFMRDVAVASRDKLIGSTLSTCVKLKAHQVKSVYTCTRHMHFRT